MADNTISTLVLKQSQELIKLVTPKITQLAGEIGIQDLLNPNLQLPDTCLPIDRLNEIKTIRDNIYDQVNAASEIIQKLSTNIDTLNKVVTTASAAIVVLKATRLILKNVAKGYPSPPGAPGFLISILDDLKELDEFLTPKVATAQVIISSISKALDFANSILAKIVNILSVLDRYLDKCLLNAPPPNKTQYLTQAVESYNKTVLDNQLNNQANAEIYNGFTLEIVEEPYSPTVNRRKAVAKNNNGIILLQTPLSFTTNTQTLIKEIKLIIDKNDLKAY